MRSSKMKMRRRKTKEMEMFARQRKALRIFVFGFGRLGKKDEFCRRPKMVFIPRNGVLLY